MNFNQALDQVMQGKCVARSTWMNCHPEDYNEYLNGDQLDERGLTRADTAASDWCVEPVRALTLTEAQLISAWNRSLPPGSDAMQGAPNSARFKRFMDALRGR